MAPHPKLNTLDRFINWAAPTWGARRVMSREVLNTYRGATSTRLDYGWPSSEGVRGYNNPLAGGVLTSMRDRARHADRNNNLASSMLDRATENVIGSGPRLQCRTSDQSFNKAAEKLFGEWCERCEVRRMWSFGAFTQLAYRTGLNEGDYGWILTEREGEPRIQAIEGDDIATPPEKVGLRDRTYDGIQFNADGRPLVFWVRTYDELGQYTYKPVDARDFIYDPRLSRFNGVRGEPIFSQTFPLFEHFDGYVEAVVTASRAAACQALLITKTNPGQLVGGLGTTTNSAGNQQKKLTLEPMMVHTLREGEGVEGFNPTFPTANFSPFMDALARLMGLKLGLTLEQVMLNFSQTNYSSSRAARLQADRTANDERDRFERRVLRRHHAYWISKMVRASKLPTPPDDFWAHEWEWDARPWVDPEKELNAALIELDMGLTTLAILAKERGREFADLVQQRSDEIKACRKAGIPEVHSTLTREPMPAPVAPAADPNAVDPELERIKAEADAYGVAVRAGVITPQTDDENAFREKLALPAMSDDTQAAWKKDEGTRRPITLAPPPGEAPATPFGGKPAAPATGDNADA